MILAGDRLRLAVLDAIASSGGASHIGSIFSVIDIVAVCVGLSSSGEEFLDLPAGDVFILSKGHAGLSVYAALVELGLCDPMILEKYYQNGTLASGHVSHHASSHIPFSTGSLGMGVSFAVGAALGSRDRKVICVVSEGDMNEGSFWESIMIAVQLKLSNLTIILDHNGLQSLGDSEQFLGPSSSFESKIEAFGVHYAQVNGHSDTELSGALKISSEKVKFLDALTVKGKGSRLMEGKVKWHYSCPSLVEYQSIKSEIENRFA